jgi:hypothetical protein
MSATQLEGEDPRSCRLRSILVRRLAKGPQRGADPLGGGGIGGVDGVAGAILEDPEGGRVASDRSPVLGGGVDQQLPGP